MRRAALIGLGLAGAPRRSRPAGGARARPTPATRLVALSALAAFERREVLAALARAAADADESVRARAIGFLAAARRGRDRRADRAPAHGRAARAHHRRAVACPSTGASRASSPRSRPPTTSSRRCSSSALARLRRRRRDAALFAAHALAATCRARKAAAAALAALGTREARAALRTRRAPSDPDPEVRRICSLLLAQ